MADIDPSFGVRKFVRTAKGNSSRILRIEFPFLKKKLPNLWANSSFISTVGGSPLNIVKRYIANQQLSQREKETKKWKDMLLTYKYKLYDHTRNKYFSKQINIAGCIYSIALHKRYYRIYKKVCIN
ncbi:MAG: putative transposase [Candidatus Xenolissoclinum pacificiensis L6]|uniref:Transposase n=1 Tax=Candidatus Xenolissoclinum pacificiensis L6 TaxID=1401685 RepID=W2UZI8_9RICK|nr:MAG: putative transposase [Candidatus Xenolissoclinum pacificiensis L6]